MSDAIELSEEESKEIEKMMEANKAEGAYKATGKGGRRVKAKKPKQNKNISKEQLEAQGQAEDAYRQVKKLLKLRTKNELIEIVWSYGAQLQEMQHVAQLLLEENKQLKGLTEEE